MSWSSQTDSQVNNIDNLDWYSSFFQNDYMENNYIEELNQQEISNPLTCKHDINANQVNSTKLNSSIQQNIYTIQEESQENIQNQASKKNLSTFNTPRNKSQVNDIQNLVHDYQDNSNQLQKTNSKFILQNNQSEDLEILSKDLEIQKQNTDDTAKNKDESQIKQNFSQSRLILVENKNEEEIIQKEADQQKQSSKQQDDYIQEEIQQKVSCYQPQQQQQITEINHKENEIELHIKKKNSSKKMQQQNKDFILDCFIHIPSKVQKQKNGECQMSEKKKDVQKEENTFIKKQNLHQNLIQINQYFDGMKFNLQKSFTFKTDEKENCKLNYVKANINQLKSQINFDNEKQSQSSQLHQKNTCNLNLNNQKVEQKKEKSQKIEIFEKNILQAQNKDVNIFLPELVFEKSQKTKQKRMPNEENGNYFSQINIKKQTNQDQIREKTKSQTFKEKSSQNEFHISKNLNFDNIFNEKAKRSEISFKFQNEFQNLSQDQKCLQINNLDFRNKNLLKTLKKFQDQFSSINDRLDSILQKSIEQKWEAQYLQEEKNNITKDIHDITQIIKKII
ncbi:hypothetical protein TTHERM_00460720 (macronuclear) [Tetrahymena thermophila SB210]|uniref:Uncharacterized protein n=1 Tax=Tetrahymena thermophila (strain SB210) TaxID=312017 RepID=Q23Q12_TETTS|nr:hypothetical protein TTHERM_00460720 [Tetrahymena thermophila SB210]EAR98523.3 hypothetical protein TTHERM_00460720 [Tetrahymena thermophila SB210]|eukprot:XP_001018768.3 hypothetical protein TTHERM_00460720 [Tetrahymena thermophila SB210]